MNARVSSAALAVLSLCAVPAAAQQWSFSVQSAFTTTVRPVRNTHVYMTQDGGQFYALQADQTVRSAAQPEVYWGVAATVRTGVEAVAKLGLQSYRSNTEVTRVSTGLLERSEEYATPYLPLTLGLRWKPARSLAIEALGAADLFGYGTQYTVDAHLHLAEHHSLYVGLLHARTVEYVNTTTADPPNWRLFYSGYTTPFPSWHVHFGYRFAFSVRSAAAVSDKTRSLKSF